MQVILRERLENLGNAGDVVSVKPGYARNYLVPKGLAYAATESNLKRIGRERDQAARREAEAVGAARESAKAIEGLSVTFTARAGEEGKLFGSITSSDIAEKLAEQGVTIDRRQIQLDEPIKALGEHSVSMRLHPEVVAQLRVNVVRE